uniref:Putative secreted protein n=1 Tax=Anopheles marajoara TaxID=58244 RepID=A0A2M4CFJ9_9DIPT
MFGLLLLRLVPLHLAISCHSSPLVFWSSTLFSHFSQFLALFCFFRNLNLASNFLAAISLSRVLLDW